MRLGPSGACVVLAITVVITACSSSTKTSSSTTTGASSPTSTVAPAATTTPASSATASSTNPTCSLLTTAEIDAAATHPTAVTLGAQASETQTLAQGDCIWRSSDDKNFVEIMTGKGAEPAPPGVTEAFPGLGTGSYFVTPQGTGSALNSQCFQVACEFTAVTNAKGYSIQVGALFAPPPSDAQAAAKALLQSIVGRLPG
jgi:hypothetical protein